MGWRTLADRGDATVALVTASKQLTKSQAIAPDLWANALGSPKPWLENRTSPPHSDLHGQNPFDDLMEIRCAGPLLLP